MNKKKFLQTIPFLVLFVIVASTWYKLATSYQFNFAVKHKVIIGLVLFNSIVYFFYFKIAVILTGAILIMSTFNIVSLFPEAITTSYFLKMGNVELSTPDLQLTAALLLIFFVAINIFIYPIFKKSEQDVDDF